MKGYEILPLMVQGKRFYESNSDYFVYQIQKIGEDFVFVTKYKGGRVTFSSIASIDLNADFIEIEETI